MSDLPNIPFATKSLHQYCGIECRSQGGVMWVVLWPSDFYLPCSLSFTVSFLCWLQTYLLILRFSNLFSFVSSFHNLLSLPLNLFLWSPYAHLLHSHSSGISNLVRAVCPLVFSLSLPGPIISIPHPNLFMSQHQTQTAHSWKEWVREQAMEMSEPFIRDPPPLLLL